MSTRRPFDSQRNISNVVAQKSTPKKKQKSGVSLEKSLELFAQSRLTTDLDSPLTFQQLATMIKINASLLRLFNQNELRVLYYHAGVHMFEISKMAAMVEAGISVYGLSRDEAVLNFVKNCDRFVDFNCITLDGKILLELDRTFVINNPIVPDTLIQNSDIIVDDENETLVTVDYNFSGKQQTLNSKTFQKYNFHKQRNGYDEKIINQMYEDAGIQKVMNKVNQTNEEKKYKHGGAYKIVTPDNDCENFQQLQYSDIESYLSSESNDMKPYFLFRCSTVPNWETQVTTASKFAEKINKNFDQDFTFFYEIFSFETGDVNDRFLKLFGSIPHGSTIFAVSPCRISRDLNHFQQLSKRYKIFCLIPSSHALNIEELYKSYKSTTAGQAIYSQIQCYMIRRCTIQSNLEKRIYTEIAANLNNLVALARVSASTKLGNSTSLQVQMQILAQLCSHIKVHHTSVYRNCPEDLLENNSQILVVRSIERLTRNNGALEDFLSKHNFIIVLYWQQNSNSITPDDILYPIQSSDLYHKLKPIYEKELESYNNFNGVLRRTIFLPFFLSKDNLHCFKEELVLHENFKVFRDYTHWSTTPNIDLPVGKKIDNYQNKKNSSCLHANHIECSNNCRCLCGYCPIRRSLKPEYKAPLILFFTEGLQCNTTYDKTSKLYRAYLPKMAGQRFLVSFKYLFEHYDKNFTYTYGQDKVFLKFRSFTSMYIKIGESPFLTKNLDVNNSFSRITLPVLYDIYCNIDKY